MDLTLVTDVSKEKILSRKSINFFSPSILFYFIDDVQNYYLFINVDTIFVCSTLLKINFDQLR